MFSSNEIEQVTRFMGNDMALRLTPYGNIVIRHNDSTKVFFVFYKREDGVIIRRRLGYENPFGSGHVLNGGKPFADVLTAVRYFAKYREKFPNSLL